MAGGLEDGPGNGLEDMNIVDWALVCWWLLGLVLQCALLNGVMGLGVVN